MSDQALAPHTGHRRQSCSWLRNLKMSFIASNYAWTALIISMCTCEEASIWADVNEMSSLGVKLKISLVMSPLCEQFFCVVTFCSNPKLGVHAFNNFSTKVELALYCAVCPILLWSTSPTVGHRGHVLRWIILESSNSLLSYLAK